MRPWKIFAGGAFAAGMFFGASLGPAAADTGIHRVGDPRLHDGNTPNTKFTGEWYREDTRPGGTVANSSDFGGPPGFGTGALKFTTDGTTNAKAQLLTTDDIYGTPLVEVNSLDYWTYHSSQTLSTANGGFDDADVSFQLVVDIDGNLNTTADRTTLVYEPYENDLEGSDPQHPEGILADTWQHWNASGGDWWSTKQIGNPLADPLDPLTIDPNCGFFHIEPGAGGPPFTQPSAVALGCPNATVVRVGLNVGSFNPNYVVAADGLHFNVLTDSYSFDFQPGPK